MEVKSIAGFLTVNCALVEGMAVVAEPAKSISARVTVAGSIDEQAAVIEMVTNTDFMSFV